MRYNIINYSHHAVHYMPGAYLFYNWNLYLLTVSPRIISTLAAGGAGRGGEAGRNGE